MGKVLKVNVAIQENPPFGGIVNFSAGDTLPEEYASLVGNHVYEEARDTTVISSVGPGELPSAPAKVEEEPEEVDVPSRGAAVATWKKFAREIGVDVPKNASRDDTIALIEQAHPDIEIPE